MGTRIVLFSIISADGDKLSWGTLLKKKNGGSSGLFTPFVHLLHLFLSIFLKERLSKAFVLIQNIEYK